MIALTQGRVQTIGAVVLSDSPASTKLVTMRDDLVVARVEKPINKTHLAGYILLLASKACLIELLVLFEAVVQ